MSDRNAEEFEIERSPPPALDEREELEVRIARLQAAIHHRQNSEAFDDTRQTPGSPPLSQQGNNRASQGIRFMQDAEISDDTRETPGSPPLSQQGNDRAFLSMTAGPPSRKTSSRSGSDRSTLYYPTSPRLGRSPTPPSYGRSPSPTNRGNRLGEPLSILKLRSEIPYEWDSSDRLTPVHFLDFSKDRNQEQDVRKIPEIDRNIEKDWEKDLDGPVAVNETHKTLAWSERGEGFVRQNGNSAASTKWYPEYRNGEGTLFTLPPSSTTHRASSLEADAARLGNFIGYFSRGRSRVVSADEFGGKYDNDGALLMHLVPKKEVEGPLRWVKYCTVPLEEKDRICPPYSSCVIRYIRLEEGQMPTYYFWVKVKDLAEDVEHFYQDEDGVLHPPAADGDDGDDDNEDDYENDTAEYEDRENGEEDPHTEERDDPSDGSQAGNHLQRPDIPPAGELPEPPQEDDGADLPDYESDPDYELEFRAATLREREWDTIVKQHERRRDDSATVGFLQAWFRNHHVEGLLLKLRRTHPNNGRTFIEDLESNSYLTEEEINTLQMACRIMFILNGRNDVLLDTYVPESSPSAPASPGTWPDPPTTPFLPPSPGWIGFGDLRPKKLRLASAAAERDAADREYYEQLTAVDSEQSWADLMLDHQRGTPGDAARVQEHVRRFGVPGLLRGLRSMHRVSPRPLIADLEALTPDEEIAFRFEGGLLIGRVIYVLDSALHWPHSVRRPSLFNRARGHISDAGRVSLPLEEEDNDNATEEQNLHLDQYQSRSPAGQDDAATVWNSIVAYQHGRFGTALVSLIRRFIRRYDLEIAIGFLEASYEANTARLISLIAAVDSNGVRHLPPTSLSNHNIAVRIANVSNGISTNPFPLATGDRSPIDITAADDGETSSSQSEQQATNTGSGNQSRVENGKGRAEMAHSPPSCRKSSSVSRGRRRRRPGSLDPSYLSENVDGDDADLDTPFVPPKKGKVTKSKKNLAPRGARSHSTTSVSAGPSARAPSLTRKRSRSTSIEEIPSPNTSKRPRTQRSASKDSHAVSATPAEDDADLSSPGSTVKPAQRAKRKTTAKAPTRGSSFIETAVEAKPVTRRMVSVLIPAAVPAAAKTKMKPKTKPKTVKKESLQRTSPRRSSRIRKKAGI